MPLTISSYLTTSSTYSIKVIILALAIYIQDVTDANNIINIITCTSYKLFMDQVTNLSGILSAFRLLIVASLQHSRTIVEQ